jgi:hypothetical protein
MIDFKLNDSLIALTSEMVLTKQNLVTKMAEVNEKLSNIEIITLSDSEGINAKEITTLKTLVTANTASITSNTRRLGNIEDYLEKTDNDGTDDEAIKFSLDIP